MNTKKEIWFDEDLIFSDRYLNEHIKLQFTILGTSEKLIFNPQNREDADFLSYFFPRLSHIMLNSIIKLEEQYKKILNDPISLAFVDPTEMQSKIDEEKEHLRDLNHLHFLVINWHDTNSNHGLSPIDDDEWEAMSSGYLIKIHSKRKKHLEKIDDRFSSEFESKSDPLPNNLASHLNSLTIWQKKVVEILKREGLIKHYDLMLEINKHVSYHHVSKIFYNKIGKRFFIEQIISESGYYRLRNPDHIPDKF